MKESIGKRIKRYRLRAGLTQQQVADAIKTSRVAVTKWEKEQVQNLEHKNLLGLSRLFKIDLEELLTGTGLEVPLSAEAARARHIADASPGADYAAVLHESAPILEWETPDDLPAGEFIIVPRYAVRVSAGNGHVVYEELQMEQGQAYRTDYIKRKGLYRRNLISIYARGSSMEPRIRDGDALLVDISQTAVQDGEVYVISYAGEARVKRLRHRPGGGLMIISDNTHGHADLALNAAETSHVTIIGKVIEISGPP